METMLNKKDVPEVEEMFELITELSTEEKQALNYMIQGIRLAKALEKKTA